MIRDVAATCCRAVAGFAKDRFHRGPSSPVRFFWLRSEAVGVAGRRRHLLSCHRRSHQGQPSSGSPWFRRSSRGHPLPRRVAKVGSFWLSTAPVCGWDFRQRGREVYGVWIGWIPCCEWGLTNIDDKWIEYLVG
ncbi:hypothetical protein Droror1_Dr00028328 [Drosera rotundifolia]